MKSRYKPWDEAAGFRYLIKDEGSSVLRETWKLYAPESLSRLTDKGIGDYDAIG